MGRIEMNETKYKHLFIIISIAIILLIPIAISDRILSNSYGQALEKTYTNQKCGISIQYPSDWKSEDYTSDDGPGHVINNIVEFQPNNSEGFHNVVGIELNDISTLSDKSFAAIKEFEVVYYRQMSHIGKVETSEITQMAGYPAQKLVYKEGPEVKNMDVFTVAFDREYKITYDASSSEYYDKYLSTVDKMIQTFKINQPTFEGINC